MDGAGVRTQRVLFVRLPPFLGYESHHPRDVTLPLTIAYAATMVKQSGRQVEVLDVWASGESMSRTVARIRAASPDAIFFEAHAGPFPAVEACARSVRRFSDAQLYCWGSVPTFLPERVVGESGLFDAAIRGEAELTVLDLVEAHDAGRALESVDGIACRSGDGGRVERTRPRAQPRDLDVFPNPDYDLFDLDAYVKFSFPVPRYRRVRWGHVLATRGCPYPCTHCSFDHRQTFGQKLRAHSPKRFVDNLEVLVRRHGINAVSIEDDIFTLDRGYVLAICDELEERRLDLVWVMQTRVDCVDRELLGRMKEVGLVGISYGIESGNDRVLAELKKGFTRQQALDGIRMTQAEGLMMRLLFMVGNPTERAEEIEDTIDLACEAQAITVQVHISTPYPGTGLLGEEGRDHEQITDFSSYNEIVQNLSEVPDSDLWALQRRFYSRYYFSWRYVATFVRQRVRYLSGSWRRDVPLALRALWYLAWTSRRPSDRDVASAFDDVATREPPSPSSSHRGEAGLRAPVRPIPRQRIQLPRGALARVRSVWAPPVGDPIARFERAFADFVGVDEAIAVPSGRAGLLFLLDALDLEDGAEVICPAFGYPVVPHVVRSRGYRLRLVDCEPQSLGMDPEALARTIGERTRVVVAAHLFGVPCRIRELRRIAEDHGAVLLEDCAHALGASVAGIQAGALGNAATFSFETSKIVNTLGGGMITTDDRELAIRLRALAAAQPPNGLRWLARRLAKTSFESLATHPRIFPRAVHPLLKRALGSSPRFASGYAADALSVAGRLGRYTAYQAELGLGQLGDVPLRREQRRANARRLTERLRGRVRFQEACDADAVANPMLVAARFDDMPAVAAALLERGIDTKRDYMRDCSGVLEVPEEFPEAARAEREVLHLPAHPELGPVEIDRVAECVESVLSERCAVHPAAE